MSHVYQQRPGFIHACFIKINGLSLSDIRFFSLLSGIVIYAVLGNPTPDHFGIAEYVIAALLFFALGAASFGNVLNFMNDRHYPLWFDVGRASFFTLVFFSSLQFLLSGNDVKDALRDLIALCFLFLPLFLFPLLKDRPDRCRLLLFCVLLLGIIFALRSLSLFGYVPLSSLLDADPLAYLSNAPSVLFTAIYLSCAGLIAFSRNNPVRHKALSILILMAVLLPLAAMMLTLQRASIGLFALSLCVFLIAGVYKMPRKALTGIAVAGIAVAFLWPYLGEALAAFEFKNRLVGDNMRLAEINAIWDKITKTPVSLLFGLGFGGNFESPAVGNYSVNFAHGLLSATLLKNGVIGVFAVAIYLFYVGRELFCLSQNKTHLFLSLICPFLICVFLYASYKSFDFGLIMTLIAFSSLAGKGDHSNSH